MFVNRIKTPMIMIVALGFILTLLFAEGGAAAFPLFQAATPDKNLLTPTVLATRVATSTPVTPISAQPVSTPQADNVFYVVKPGDTLWTIATKVYGNGAQYILIQRANDLPNNAILQVGSSLIIPSIPPPNAPPTLAAVTSTPANTLAPTATTLPSNTESPIPTQTPVRVATATLPAPAPATPINPGSTPSNFSFSPLLPFIQVVLYILSALCLLGSCFSAYLALESYQRSRPYIRRRHIGNRVRSGL